MKHSTALAERSWTKADELAWLETAIEDLGDYSYLGPWLREYRECIAADIRNDVGMTAPMPGEAQRQALAILADAREQEKAILSAAHASAIKVRDDMNEQISRTRERERLALQRIVDSL